MYCGNLGEATMYECVLVLQKHEFTSTSADMCLDYKRRCQRAWPTGFTVNLCPSVIPTTRPILSKQTVTSIFGSAQYTCYFSLLFLCLIYEAWFYIKFRGIPNRDWFIMPPTYVKKYLGQKPLHYYVTDQIFNYINILETRCID